MRKIIALALFLAACSKEECPIYDIKPAGTINGYETFILRIDTAPGEEALTERDSAIIYESQTCTRGFQDINIQYEPETGVGPAYKNIHFYCL